MTIYLKGTLFLETHLKLMVTEMSNMNTIVNVRLGLFNKSVVTFFLTLGTWV